MGIITQQFEDGFTLAELVIGLTVLAVVIVTFFALFFSLVSSSVIAQQKAIASTLATNQMEYLKSLPYDSLAVAGGSIYTTNPLPASITQKVNGVTYTVKTSVNFVDDAYDGCANYPTQALKQLYCRNYPPPAGALAVDLNPEDYKIVHVSVYIGQNTKLAEVDTQVSARVAETASSTGALFVTVVDDNGNPVTNATVTVVNNSLAPALNLSDNTDVNGIAIFFGLPPDNPNYHYNITASKSGYSTLSTIVPVGSLQPNYSNQNIFVQKSSSVTLTIKPQGTYSLALETTDTNGNPLGNVKVYIKGGYKKYTATSDTSYYFDNMSPDSRPTTDANGLSSLTNLVPSAYIFCGDNGSTGCSSGSTNYYLAAALPYGGANPFYDVVVPRYDPASPPTTTFSYNGNNYLQKVRLMFTTNPLFPRINNISPYDVSLSSSTLDLDNFSFQVNGVNLPCSSSASSCGTSVKFIQNNNTYTASCTGTTSTQLNCTVDLTGIGAGNTQMVVSSNGNSLTMPVAPPLGGLIVTP